MRQVLFVMVLLILPSPAPACSLCGSLGVKISLAQEFDNAHAVIYGYIANPKFDVGDATGRGTTEFHCEKFLKDDPKLPRQKVVMLSRYLPILDAKELPRYLMFFGAPAKTFEPYTGRQLTSPAILDFLAEYQRHRKEPLQALSFAFSHFDHADPTVAEEAFLIFARSDDAHISQLAKMLAPDKLRKLLKTPDLEPERLSMFAYLLGTCGDERDGELLRSLLKAPNERNFKSFEGILAGYIALRPQEGWAFALEALKNEKTSLLLRYATLRTLRFYYNANAKEFGPRVLEGLGLAVENSDVADIAIQDLSRWQRWEHTKLILASYDKASHRSPIVKNSIVRYALICPLPEARNFVDRVRREDPALVHDFEEQIRFDRK